VSTGEFLPWGQSSQGIKLTIHLHLELRLRMSGAIPQLPICALTVWIGKTSPSIPTTGQDHNYPLICYDKCMLYPLINTPHIQVSIHCLLSYILFSLTWSLHDATRLHYCQGHSPPSVLDVQRHLIPSLLNSYLENILHFFSFFPFKPTNL